MQGQGQGHDRLEMEVLGRVPISRRDFVRRTVAGTAFAVPVLASFDMVRASSAAADSFDGSSPPDIASIAPNHGPATGGTTVTINFAQTVVSPQAVYFGDTPAASFSVPFSYAFSMTAVSPPGIGSVIVTVTDNYGHTSSATDADATFTYDAIATTLETYPLSRTRVRPSARLIRADTGAPIAGEPIAFSDARGPLGVATTGSDGVATLAAVPHTPAAGFTAEFAGGDGYGPSSAGGTLT